MNVLYLALPTQALLSSGLQSLLLALLTRDHMAPSLQLLILRTLDSSLDCQGGAKLFLDQGGYGRLVELAAGTLQTRTKVAF